MRFLGVLIILAVMAFILTGCGKKEPDATPGVHPYEYNTQTAEKPDDTNKLYLTESTTASGVKCITAAYYASVALSCDWK